MTDPHTPDPAHVPAATGGDGGETAPVDAAMTPQQALAEMLREVRRVVVGSDRAIERIATCVVAGGHVLIEGVPGLGKTVTAASLADAIGGSFSRIQFTADLLPSDVVGTRIWRPEEGVFTVEHGPVFANVVLADEINRSPAKVQSAMLEVMAERQVTLGGETFKVPRPFMVMATQNPLEQEGVYQLPEAQRDRFLMRILVGYPSLDEEHLILSRMEGESPRARPVANPTLIEAAQHEAQAVVVDEAVVDYILRLIATTRDPEEMGIASLAGVIEAGASPRASIGILRGARALTLLRGGTEVTPQEVYDIAYDVLNHRIQLTFDALADGRTEDEVLDVILRTVQAPRLGTGRCFGESRGRLSGVPWDAPEGDAVPSRPAVPVRSEPSLSSPGRRR
jgi:MoxR-like ATPase